MPLATIVRLNLAIRSIPITPGGSRMRALFFVSSILLSILTLYSCILRLFFVYFILAVPMNECLGKYSCLSSPLSVAILSNMCCLLCPGIDFVLVGECFGPKIMLIALTKYWKQYSTEIRDKRTFLAAGTIGSLVQLCLRLTEGRTVRDYISRMPEVNYPI